MAVFETIITLLLLGPLRTSGVEVFAIHIVDLATWSLMPHNANSPQPLLASTVEPSPALGPTLDFLIAVGKVPH